MEIEKITINQLITCKICKIVYNINIALRKIRGVKVEFEKIENSIGYTFKNKELLKKALTHTSYAYENNIESNEKLHQ